MERKTIYEDRKMLVEAVFIREGLLYTETHYIDETDSRPHLVRVWYDGTVWKE